MKDFFKLEEKIGFSFKNKNLLKQSMVHRSYLNEHPSFELDNNERLEFLGDAVLELAVTESLYRNYPNPEGELTNWRASLVNAKMLSEIAFSLGLENYLYLSKGESRDTSSKARHYILADAFEALIGAIYLDQGMPKAKKFIKRVLLVKLPYIIKNRLYIDPKTSFQEKAQEKVNITPSYKVLEESGPDHAKHFSVGVYLNETLIGIGKGSSKQEAQEDAAEKALKNKKW